MPKIDTQVVELIGRNRLVSELLRAKLEVAVPARDRGIDLIAYADLSTDVKRFIAKPIQMKAASRASFSVAKKFERVADLIVAYVWYLEDLHKAVTFALTTKEALDIADAMGFLKTPYWEKHGYWASNKPGVELRKLLLPFEMDSEKWRAKILGRKSSN
jgi:hypothetical protein